MDYINAIIFGIIQGITEFLPISSSGHLVIIHEFIQLPIKDDLAFDVILHLATLLAVILFFKKEVWLLIKSWFNSFRGKNDVYCKLSWLIILGTIPAGLVGLLFEKQVEQIFRSPIIVAIMLIIVGALFIIFEKVSQKADNLDKLNWRKTLLIGSAQAVALIPGTSRSGITIIAGLGAGLKREAAIKFSFLLSIPIIATANLKEAPSILNLTVSGNDIIFLLLAFLFAWLTGFLAIKYFLRFARSHSLNIFAIYRFILATVIMIYFFGF